MELIVTNMHRRFTGVSATTAAVTRKQADRYDLQLVGSPLPGCPDPISVMQAVRSSRQTAPNRQHVLWHVRRPNEMRAALFARNILKCPIKIVYTASGQRSPSRRMRRLMRKMDAVIGASRLTAGKLPNLRAIIHHGVDTELFHPAEDRLQSWRDSGMSGTIGVATVGRIRPEKGTDLFVEAMLGLLPKYREVTAIVVGATSREHRAYENALHQRIAAAGLTDRFVFTGKMAPDAVPEFVRSLSLLVAPPRYEGFSLTPLEAMASGVPVVATNTGYFPTFIGKNEAGIVVHEPNVAALAGAIDAMLDDPLKRGALNATARERAVARFSVDNEVLGISRVYEELWRA